MNYIQLQIQNYKQLSHKVLNENLPINELSAILDKMDILKEIIKLHGYKLASPLVSDPMTPRFIPII